MNMISLATIPDSDIISYKFLFQQVNPTPMNFTSATNSQDIFLFGMPPNYAVCMVKINPQIAFVGPSLATMTCEVGPSAVPTFYATAFSVMQTAAYQLTTPLAQYQTSAHDINARFISTGASINAVTAGQVEITVQIRPLA